MNQRPLRLKICQLATSLGGIVFVVVRKRNKVFQNGEFAGNCTSRRGSVIGVERNVVTSTTTIGCDTGDIVDASNVNSLSFRQVMNSNALRYFASGEG